MTPRGTAFVALVVLAALAGLEVWRIATPEPAPAEAPADEFSATRAIATLRAVSLDEPHPLGTAAHDVVRDRIASALRALDYAVEIEHTFACSAAATCGYVDNVIAVTGLVRRWASFDAVFDGHALAWNALALVAAAMLPGAAYLFAVPGAVMAVLAVLPVGATIASVGSLAGAATVCLPFALLGHDAMGDPSLTAAAVLLALVATTFAPLVSETARGLMSGCLALAVVLGVVAALLPRHSATHPLQRSLQYFLDADAGTARWKVDDPTPELGAVAAFEPAGMARPWSRASGTAEVAPAPAEPLPPPVATVSTLPGDGTPVVTIEASSARHAPRLAFYWHGDVQVLRINGFTPPGPSTLRPRALAPGWNRIELYGSAAGLQLTLRGAAPVEAYVVDTSYGLPASAAPLIKARDASGAVPVHDGGVTRVERRVRW